MESQLFKVGEFFVNSLSNSIYRDGKSSDLPPRLIDVLVFLAGCPGEVVSRQEIIDHCWDRGCVTDQVVTQAIFELRKFLKDGRKRGEAPEYIRTVPKRGYKLVVDVLPLNQEEYEKLKSGTIPQKSPEAAVKAPVQKNKPVRLDDAQAEENGSLLSKVSSALWLDQMALGFKKGPY